MSSPPVIDPPKSRFTPLVIGIALVVTVCFVALGAVLWRLADARNAQLQESRVAASNLARALAQHASDALLQADAVVVAVSDRMHAGGTGAENIADVHRLLVAEMAELPQLQRLSVIDETGSWLTTDLKATNPGVGHTDREYFEYHQSHVDPAPHLGPPIRARTTDQWIVTVSRRLEHADGSFAGLVLASIDLGYFGKYYSQFDIGNDGALVLLMSDGTVLDRRPFRADLPGTRVTGGPLYSEHIAKGSNAGVAMITSKIDGVQRLTAYQKIERFPVFMVVAFATSDVLAGWHRDAAVHLGGALALALALAFVGAHWLRRYRDRHATGLLLAQSQAQTATLEEKLRGLASEDALTGLLNRRAFDRLLVDEVKRIDRSGGPLAMVLVDVDRFKTYNDFYGHPKGDECLRMIGHHIRACVHRPGDVAARFDGKEFALLLPSTDAAGAMTIAESVHRAVRAMDRMHPGSSKGIVTVSLGIGILIAGEPDATPDLLLLRARKGLFAAKESGRDSIRAHEPL